MSGTNSTMSGTNSLAPEILSGTPLKVIFRLGTHYLTGRCVYLNIPEVDLLSTPVRPVTVTKLIQDLCPQRDDVAASPDLSKLVPPSTTTPLMKSLAQGQGGDSNFNTPDSSTELLVAPATRTPLIKADQSDSSTPIPKIDNSPTDDFPTPPTFTTPGLQKYGSKKHYEHSLLKDAINTPPPPPPTFSTVHLLIPGTSSHAWCFLRIFYSVYFTVEQHYAYWEVLK